MIRHFVLQSFLCPQNWPTLPRINSIAPYGVMLFILIRWDCGSNPRALSKAPRKSAMPLPVADEGMALFPQPQLLQGYANTDLQKLNAARWFCFNLRRQKASAVWCDRRLSSFIAFRTVVCLAKHLTVGNIS